jgi:hypothetical protein
VKRTLLLLLAFLFSLTLTMQAGSFNPVVELVSGTPAAISSSRQPSRARLPRRGTSNIVPLVSCCRPDITSLAPSFLETPTARIPSHTLLPG